MSSISMRMNMFLWTLALCSFLILWQMGPISNRRTELSKKTVEVDVTNTTSQVFSGIEGLDQTDKRLLVYVRTHHITLPSVLEYNFGTTPAHVIEVGFDDVIRSIFKNKTGGFFVEVGAYDGMASHTLWFERELGWNGLLIECVPELIPTLKSVNRKAFIADVCLSTLNHPAKMKMNIPDHDTMSGSLGIGPKYFTPGRQTFATIEVQTIPLYSILASIDVKEVDLFVFDIQGMESEVLKNFPFDLVLVKVWVIEVQFYSEEERKWLKTFMASKGYPDSKFRALNSQWGDYMFVHKSFQ